MLKDITIDNSSGNHPSQVGPRVKIIITFVFIVIIFLSEFYRLWNDTCLYGIGCYSFGVPSGICLRAKPLLFIIALTFYKFFTSGEKVIFKFWFFTLTQEGLLQGVFMGLRLIFLVAGTSLLTLTTSPIALTDGIEHLLQPLKIFRFPVHELAMMMTIALRFIPTLLEETDKIMKAQMARGADFEIGNLFQRAKALVPLLVPLFISAFRRADELAMAMESRCYRGGENRTRMKIPKTASRDYIALAVTFLLVLGILLNSYL